MNLLTYSTPTSTDNASQNYTSNILNTPGLLVYCTQKSEDEAPLLTLICYSVCWHRRRKGSIAVQGNGPPVGALPHTESKLFGPSPGAGRAGGGVASLVRALLFTPSIRRTNRASSPYSTPARSNNCRKREHEQGQYVKFSNTSHESRISNLEASQETMNVDTEFSPEIAIGMASYLEAAFFLNP